jgi:CubicO group peptidase (beta-lactamase class C family)
MTDSPRPDWVPGEELLAEVARVAGAMVTEGRAPGVAWGVVTRAGLAAAGGSGVARLGGAAPTAASVFRIASMSKSFTAATVLRLAERGVWRLDDPVAGYVPEFGRVTPYSADSPPVSLAHLLSMSSGLATDDPWADRQESLPADGFRKEVARGLRAVAAPGVTFEYSNTGYALLGAAIANVTGQAFPDVVREAFLEPLGLTGTWYDYARVPEERLTRGYFRAKPDGPWEEQAFSGPGAYSSIGGVLSCVEDLARWVAWLADGFPARDDPDPGPLGRASRRAMQVPHIDWAPVLRAGSSRGRLTVQEATEIGGYGYGLFTQQDPRFGPTAEHPGGYPGYGTSMRWQRDSGIGVIVLANGRYAPSRVLSDRLLKLVLADAGAVGLTVTPWPETRAAALAITAALAAGDDPYAAVPLSDNVTMDLDLERRRAALAATLARLGPVAPDAAPELLPDAVTSSAHLVWTLPAARGRLRCEIKLTPQDPPAVQYLTLEAVPALPPDDVVQSGPSVAVAW